MSVLVWAIFDDGERARASVDALIEAEFPPDDVKLIMRRNEGVEEAPLEHRTAVPEGAAIGATIGAAGAATAVLLTGGGGVLAAGPVAALLQASGMGAALGGVAGAVGGLGWWKDEAAVPTAGEDEPDEVLVCLPVPHGRQEAAHEVLREAGAVRQGTASPDAAARVAVAE
jgi:hypothetical protein